MCRYCRMTPQEWELRDAITKAWGTESRLHLAVTLVVCGVLLAVFAAALT